jgi:hypothetical protein
VLEAIDAQPETRVNPAEEFSIWIRRNPLKRRDSTKRIQGNARIFLGFVWFRLDLFGGNSRSGCLQALSAALKLVARSLVLGLVFHDEGHLGEREQEGKGQEAEGLELDPKVGRLRAPDDLVENSKD